MERGYRSVGYALLALPAVMVAGFWVPYFSLFLRFSPDITTSVHVHALLQFTWVALAVVQPLAIRAGAFRTHRLLGRSSYALAPLLVLFAMAMIFKEYGEHRAEGMSALNAFAAEYLSFMVLPGLVALYLLAVASIRRGAVGAHLRYMLCLAVVLSTAGVGRILGYLFGVKLQASMSVSLLLVDACLLALILYDRRRAADPGPYRLTLGIWLAIEAGWLFLGRPV